MAVFVVVDVVWVEAPESADFEAAEFACVLAHPVDGPLPSVGEVFGGESWWSSHAGSLWVGVVVGSPLAHGVGVDVGERGSAVARLERAAHLGARQPKLCVRSGVWVPGMHGDLPAACAPRRARYLPGPSPCVSVRLPLGVWTGANRPYQHA